MARRFDSPMTRWVLLLQSMLLFGAPRLPGMARRLGQSLRILGLEVAQVKEDPPGAA